MILITLLLLTLVILGVIMAVIVSALGAGSIFLFGDVIVCMVFIILLIRFIIKKRK